MNEQLQERLLRYLDSIEQAIASGAEQVPLVVNEILLYYRVLYTVGFVIALSLLVLGSWMASKWWRHGRHVLEDLKGKAVHQLTSEQIARVEEFSVSRVIVGVFLMAIGIVWMAVVVVSFLKVWLAPRLFLIELIRDMI